MSNTTSQWTWDEARGLYYYISQLEGCYVYQNGLRVRFASQNPEVATSNCSTTPHEGPYKYAEEIWRRGKY